MSLKHGLLGLLNYGNMTGYDIDRTFKDSLFLFWQAADKPNLPGVKHNGKAGMAYIGNCNTDR